MEQKLLEEDLKSNRLGVSAIKKPANQQAEGKDLLDKFSQKFKKSFTEFKDKFTNDDKQNAENKGLK